MSDLREQCVSEEPISEKRCTLPANHDVHRNNGTAWSTDHEAWRAALDAKGAVIMRMMAEKAALASAVERLDHQRDEWAYQSAQNGMRADQAEVAIERVKELHQEAEGGTCAYCWTAYPCPTILALDQPGDQTKEPT